MDRAVRRWASSLPSDLVTDADIASLTKVLGRSYTVYGTMLLLPPETIDGGALKAIFGLAGDGAQIGLYEHISKELKVTHIAVNKPIPPSQTAGEDGAAIANVIRSPVNFQPVHGNFGPSSCTEEPSQADLDQAYWVTAKQNGISQTWAPRWTMFSRGNISEKARLLQLNTVKQAANEGSKSGEGSTIVDLYAGIGYFTFSYLKAGMNAALCWEINAWSCEGLRRGAAANKWAAITYDDGADLDRSLDGAKSIVIFNESNELALSRLDQIRSSLPPVRHVNCGLLPTSKGSWTIAYGCLDHTHDGWVHVHENFALAEIDHRAEDVRRHFQSLLNGARQVQVVLQHVHKVKTYAPGVWHCVIDLCIPAHK